MLRVQVTFQAKQQFQGLRTEVADQKGYYMATPLTETDQSATARSQHIVLGSYAIHFDFVAV